MPKITKDTEKEIEIKKDAKSTTKKTTTKRSTKKDTTSKVNKKTTKVSTETNKKDEKKATAKKSKSSTKKTTTKKSSVAKVSTTKKKASKKSDTKKVSIMEYYDLPYRYNQTIVKILAQTPKMLFVYWDISDDDRKAFENHYGDDFFSKTKPVLIIHNETMNYSFEVEINDFANSWYLHINDANCKYSIELGRRPLPYISNIQEGYIYVSSSNKMDAPNNHILFEKFNPNVVYKNTKNGSTYVKDFSSLSNYKHIQTIYNVYDLYKQLYKDELFSEVISEPANPSSIFKKSNIRKGDQI